MSRNSLALEEVPEFLHVLNRVDGVRSRIGALQHQEFSDQLEGAAGVRVLVRLQAIIVGEEGGGGRSGSSAAPPRLWELGGGPAIKVHPMR